MACARTVGIDRMARCRWHRAFCLDDDCVHPRHPMTVPCDSDMPLCETCEDCQDFDDHLETT